jgi:hypothetical protein
MIVLISAIFGISDTSDVDVFPGVDLLYLRELDCVVEEKFELRAGE